MRIKNTYALYSRVGSYIKTMEKILLTFLIIIWSNSINAQSFTKTVKKNNKFSFELFKEVFINDSNSFISPYSISSALAMTYAGAKGNTEKQMADVLHFEVNQIKTHIGFNLLNTYFNRYDSDSSTILSIANAIWKDENWHFKQEYLDLANKYYQASIYPLKSAKEINTWVNKETRNKIPKIVEEGDLANARMVITNAIYFKRNWLYSFKKENTRLSDFNGQQVKTMSQKGNFKYFADENNQVIELPYQNENISMVVILPRTENNITDLVEELDYTTCQFYLNSLIKIEVNLSLPKFKVETTYDIGSSLKKMGMIDAFDVTRADFTGMSTGLSISKIIHKAFVEVNEEGTEAAAATAVIMTEKAARRSVDFKADRPFIFFLKDNESNSILFIGAIVNP
jgi:serpin B